MAETLAPSTSAFHPDKFEERRHATLDFPFRVCREFWFSDGNVILSAGSFAFKVHRGQLERHAEIFQTMLSIPQPENTESTIHLCDSPTDVYHLLRALYDGLYFRQPFVQDFPFLASVLRLSCKYFICVPRRQCLERLQSYFPTTLAEWDRRERMALAPDGHYDPRHEIPSPIHVINLARELGVGSVLPAAFYDLARYGTSKTAGGTEPLPHLVLLELPGGDSENSPASSSSSSSPSSSITTTTATATTTIEGGAGGRGETSSPFGTSSDGTDHRGYPSSSPPPPPPPLLPLPPPSSAAPPSPPPLILAQDAAPVRLAHDDLVLTFRGREALQRAVAAFLDAQVKSRAPAAGCAGGQACRDAFYFIALNTLRAVGGIAAGRDGDPLFTLAQMVDMLHHTEWVDGQYLRGLPMCGKCREEFVPAVHAGRQAIWDQVPVWFGLEPYDVLRARDEELNERDVYP